MTNINNKVMMIFCLVCLISIGLFGQEEETSFNAGTISETVVDTFALLFLLFGTYFAWELYHIMKGGELASSWGWLAGGTVIFAIIKIIDVAQRAGYFPVPSIVISVGYLFVSLFLFLGFLKQRKTLG